MVSTSFDQPSRLIRVDVDDGTIDDLRVPPDAGFGPGLVSTPETITFDTPDGPAHALVYPPANPGVSAPPGDLPPAIVTIHGGPTARVAMSLNVEHLFWTSRGFAIIDVDYGGSTGHGRSYRNRLRGQWGVVDVRDCALAAAHCAATGMVDGSRLVIRGGSAGGYTVLMALALHDVFDAGIARYPVTDLVALATDTHKFESRYLDSLIGPYPEMADTYRDRSPTTHVDRIDAPVLLLQGSDDRVVPPSQPIAIRDALEARGVSVTYVEFAGEGHGFRSELARVQALEAELAFIVTALGIDLPDSPENDEPDRDQ
jgi:dipeptidyl aminopeptidase/acylaminoacyl peptidase